MGFRFQANNAQTAIFRNHAGFRDCCVPQDKRSRWIGRPLVDGEPQGGTTPVGTQRGQACNLQEQADVDEAPPLFLAKWTPAPRGCQGPVHCRPGPERRIAGSRRSFPNTAARSPFAGPVWGPP